MTFAKTLLLDYQNSTLPRYGTSDTAGHNSKILRCISRFSRLLA